jgi:hypothetical protein
VSQPDERALDVRALLDGGMDRHNPWTLRLNALRTELPAVAVPLARAITTLAPADTGPMPDLGDPIWARLRALIEALRMVAPLLPAEPRDWPDPALLQDVPKEVYRMRLDLAVVREELATITRREEAASRLGLDRYALTLVEDEERARGVREDGTLTLNRAIAWEYAHGQDPATARPWSMDGLARYIGVGKARVSQRIQAGRESWAKGGTVLPR